MKIKYKLIKKIHLYAGLSTTALLIMFILTSYLMIYHKSFSHESTKETQLLDVEQNLASEAEWTQWIEGNNITGRLVRSELNKQENPFQEYAHAGGNTRITYLSEQNKMEVVQTHKSTSDALEGIHRLRGFGGGFSYNLYAILLDLLGISLILFTITGIFMWMKLLKHDKWAWIVFVCGFLYFSFTLIYLTYII
ncbi:PepSY domain-containing protein [Chondrinema litorale]|uniref:PepSY domain-containing protein n=1 Tax=Chondrinema litorale TaxID=2994555 RepID=UPI002543005A|nr:PepSY domain-containing protein [Chondrinema litorale]UZR97179.1 PepSY domain-containing protein [Chondrinema litorale]